jgi:hypothetical protein
VRRLAVASAGAALDPGLVDDGEVEVEGLGQRVEAKARGPAAGGRGDHAAPDHGYGGQDLGAPPYKKI